MHRKLLTLASLVLVTVFAATPATAQICPEPTPAELMAATMETIGDLGLNSGNTQSLLGTMANALTDLTSGDTEGALQQLGVLVKKIDAQTGKALTEAQASQLLALVQTIIDELTPPSCVCNDLFPAWIDVRANPDLTLQYCVQAAYGPGTNFSRWLGFTSSTGAYYGLFAENAPNYPTRGFNCSVATNDGGLSEVIFPITEAEANECIEWVGWYAEQAGLTCFEI